MRIFRPVLLAAALLTGAPLFAETPPPPAAAAPATPQALAMIAEDAALARQSTLRGQLDVAEKFYSKLLIVEAPDSAKKQALFDMFECYRTHWVYSKAIAVGECIHQMFPNDTATPNLLLDLGRLYRDIGAYQLATARFYNVLNAALRVDQAELARYKDFSKQAQFEIAETFMISGDYSQAARMYSLLDRLDLSTDQKAHSEFQIVYSKFLLADYTAAVSASRQFIESFGSTTYAPQCHYVLSVALKAVGRPQEAADEALTLLRIEKKSAKSDAASWTYWQKKTGNQLANEMYQQGDYLRALTIYQAMAKLGDDPAWQWPVIYQVGLCFERLGLPDRATEAYDYIQDENKKAQAASKPVSDDLAELTRMAEWRGQHVQWQQTTGAQLNDLLGPMQPASAAAPQAPANSVTATN